MRIIFVHSNDLIKVNDLKFNDITYKKEILFTMYKKIIRLIQTIKCYFYNALLSLKLNGSFYKITVPFLGNTHSQIAVLK